MSRPVHAPPPLTAAGRIRNFGIIAHIDAGKTTTTENLLRYARVIHAMGTVDDGTTTTDDYVLEQQKGITIFSAAVTCHWRDHTLNLIDTPGHVDFTAEVERALRVVDGAVVVLDAVSGVEAQTETVWRQAVHYGVPCLCFLNKMDKVGADFPRSLDTLRHRLEARPVVLTMPVGVEEDFCAVIDVVRLKQLHFDPATEGETVLESDVPPALLDAARRYHALAAEAAAEFDDELMAKYLHNQPLSIPEIQRGLRLGTLAGKIQPTYAAASKHHLGIQPMMDGIVDFLPSPLDRPVIEGHDPAGQPARRDLRRDAHACALAFKTATDTHGDLTFLRLYTGTLQPGDSLLNPRLRKPERPLRLYRMFANHRRDPLPLAGPGDIVAVVGLKGTVTGDTLCDKAAPILLERMQFPEPVLQVAIEPKASADKDRLDTVLHALAKDDPTFRVTKDNDTGQTMLQCMGELHAEVLLFRITHDFKVPATLREPRVAYKETPQSPAEAEATCAVKLGDKSVFGHVQVRVAPSRAQISPRITEDLLPESSRKLLARFLPAIRNGLRSEAERGPVAGFPLVYADIALLNGTVTAESSEAAYSAAAASALRNALPHTNATIVEPHMKLEVTLPSEAVGDLLNDLNRRGATITDMRPADTRRKRVTGHVPLSKMFGYATTMRSITGGLGEYTLEPFDYRPVAKTP
ncbi:MAG: elongation factor G [Verrucomicrobia bacterium]|nr:elongation factor G [Verrucomicrobiota bacterium]